MSMWSSKRAFPNRQTCDQFRHTNDWRDLRGSTWTGLPESQMYLQGMWCKRRGRHRSMCQCVQRQDRVQQGIGVLRLLQGGRQGSTPMDVALDGRGRVDESRLRLVP